MNPVNNIKDFTTQWESEKVQQIAGNRNIAGILFIKENACKNLNPIKIRCKSLENTLKCKENVFPAICYFQ